MKIFVVTADVELIEKPVWLDDFRKRYDKAYDYHITLKQPCFIEDNQVDDIKDKLTELFSTAPSHAIDITFDVLTIDEEAPDDICIMINATDGEVIGNLQRAVVNTLEGYNRYYKPEYKSYEQTFEPHITIGRSLNSEQCAAAKKELAQGYLCKGIITKVKLIVVNNFGPEEANDPKNQTIYKLE